MSRIRSIKPEWLEDERLITAGSDARVASIALIILADDYGRGRLTVATAARIFPETPENFREAFARLSGWFVEEYHVRGQGYFRIVNWDKHQKVDKPGKPHVPPPETACISTIENHPEAPENFRESLAPDLRICGPKDPDREGNAGEPATPPPSEPIRRRDVHDYHGAQATAAQVALSAACQAAGGAPRPRGGFAQQQAWSQVACDAHELSEALQRPVAEVLAVSATGFVASRGVQASPVWWAEDFARYYDAGCKGAPRKAGSMTPLPKPEDYRPTTDEELDAMFGPEVSA